MVVSRKVLQNEGKIYNATPFFLSYYPEYCMVPSPGESNPRSPTLRANALLTGLIQGRRICLNRGGGIGGLPCEVDGDARRKIQIKA